MEIKILHIDDQPDVLEGARAVVNNHIIGEHTLKIVDSCNFEEGMRRLSANSYDLVVLDLCVGKAAEESEKIGTEVFEQIQQRAFIPTLFFTGLPGYVAHLKSSIVGVAGKADGYDELFLEIERLITSGYIELKYNLEGIVSEALRSYFWGFVHKNTEVIEALRQDDVSLKYLLLRRLGKSLSSDNIKNFIDDPKHNKENGHPMEYYIFPPVGEHFETGDIVKNKASGEIFVVMTPICDMVLRAGGSRNAERILLIRALDFRTFPEVRKVGEIEAEHAAIKANGQEVSQKKSSELKNAYANVKDLMKPNRKERYFFIPPTVFIQASMIDFQQKISVTYEELEAGYDRVATLDDPISQAVLTSYGRYFSRIGYQDLDLDYAMAKIFDTPK